MPMFNIYVKKKNVIALSQDSSNEHKNSILDSGFKYKDEIDAEDKQAAVLIWTGKNPTKRSILSRINNWIYIAFNVLMAYWWLSYTGEVSQEIAANHGDSAVQGAQVIGGAFGTGFIFAIWIPLSLIGLVIVYITRAKPWIK